MAVWGVLRRLSPDRFAVAMAAGPAEAPAEDIADAVAASGIPVLRIPALRREVDPVRDATALWQLMRAIGKDRYDLVHCHTSKAGFLGRLAARLCGVRGVVYTPHGTVLEGGYFGRAATWAFARLEGVAAPLADRIVSLTPRETARYLEEGIGRPDQHTFIFNGIDVEAFGPEAGDRATVRREMGVSSDAFLVVSVGRLASVKGHVHLIEAMPEVLRRHPEALMMVVGEGPLRPDLIARARSLGVAERLRLPGHRQDVARLLRAADLFALPSLNEGLGLALLEAMAAGLAAVASRAGGVPEVVVDGETGLLVPPGNARALAKAILALAEDSGMRGRMGAAGRERARRHFSIALAVRETERLYEALMS